MNYGMIGVYVFFAIWMLQSAFCEDAVAMFWATLVDVAILITLLAWSHGWHLTWVQ